MDNNITLAYFDLDGTEQMISEETIYNAGKSYKMSVYGGERNIPHVHIKRKDKLEVCVCLNTNKYYKHDGKTGEFNSIQKKNFQNIMSTTIEDGVTLWDYACIKWNILNDNYKFNPPKSMPSYREMKESITEMTR